MVKLKHCLMGNAWHHKLRGGGNRTRLSRRHSCLFMFRSAHCIWPPNNPSSLFLFPPAFLHSFLKVGKKKAGTLYAVMLTVSEVFSGAQVIINKDAIIMVWALRCYLLLTLQQASNIPMLCSNMMFISLLLYTSQSSEVLMLTFITMLDFGSYLVLRHASILINLMYCKCPWYPF